MPLTRLLAFSLAVIFLNAVVADTAELGKSTFEQQCVACHGKQAEGNQALKAPALAGQDEWYIKNQLIAFQKGYRGTAEGDASGAGMAAISKSLNASQINGIALFIQAKPKAAMTATIKGDALKGQQYYDTLCGSCHGPEGKGNAALNSPKLAGLNDWYIVEQINKFRAAKRGYHQDDRLGKQMKMMSSIVPGDEATKDIATYLSAQ